MYNEIGDEALEIMARSVFTENREIRNVILNNNRIGAGTFKASIVIFLEAFLLELYTPENLDLSSNMIGDTWLEPIARFCLANHECKIHSLNIEYNCFSNFAKRTFA